MHVSVVCESGSLKSIDLSALHHAGCDSFIVKAFPVKQRRTGK